MFRVINHKISPEIPLFAKEGDFRVNDKRKLFYFENLISLVEEDYLGLESL